jgi:hypothetical protein
MIAGGMLFMVVILAGGALAFLSGGEEQAEPTELGTNTPQPVATKTEPTDPAPDEPATDEPAENPTPTVRILTPGVDATVYDGEERLGETPFSFEAAEEKTLTFRAEGFAEATATVGPESEELLEVEMEPSDEADDGRDHAPSSDEPSDKPKTQRPRDERPTGEERDNSEGGWVDVPVEPTATDEEKAPAEKQPQEDEKKEDEEEPDIPIF